MKHERRIKFCALFASLVIICYTSRSKAVPVFYMSKAVADIGEIIRRTCRIAELLGRDTIIETYNYVIYGGDTMNIALILAGGTGERLMRGRPKPFVSVRGTMIITHCLAAVGAHPLIDAIQIVAEEEWREKIYEQMPEAALKKLSGFSKPGPNRQRSIFNGLKTIMPSAKKSDIIVIHDATRPLVPETLITACVKACEKYDGGIPVLPVLDTIYMRKERCVDSFHKRGTVYTQQTPEAYRLKKYYAANQKLLPDKLDQINDSAEPAVLAGMNLVMFLGEATNFRIETLIDLERLKVFINI